MPEIDPRNDQYNTLDESMISDSEIDLQNKNWLEELQLDAIEYISGFILKKLNLKNEISDEAYFSWIDHVTEGGLKKPHPKFISKITELEHIFRDINGNKLCSNEQFLKYHIDKSFNVDLPLAVKKLYFKIRLYNRIKNLNKNNNDQISESRKKKKKMMKITS